MDCKYCGTLLERKRYGTQMEAWTRFSQRIYCNQTCMAKGMEGVIKVMNDKNSRRQSGKEAKKNCQSCGASGKLHVHHQDENPTNNAPSNLMTLCPSCHRRCHSPNYTATGEQRRPCEFCAEPSMKRGWCFTHLTRYKRFGHPLAKKRKTASGWVLMLHDGKNWLPFHLSETPGIVSAGSVATVTR